MDPSNVLHGWGSEVQDLARALGIEDPAMVRRFVLDIEAGEVAKLYVERYADKRGLEVLKALAPRVQIVEGPPAPPKPTSPDDMSYKGAA